MNPCSFLSHNLEFLRQCFSMSGCHHFKRQPEFSEDFNVKLIFICFHFENKCHTVIFFSFFYWREACLGIKEIMTRYFNSPKIGNHQHMALEGNKWSRGNKAIGDQFWHGLRDNANHINYPTRFLVGSLMLARDYALEEICLRFNFGG